MIPPHERVIVALDVPDWSGLQALLDRLEAAPVFYKIGLELFIAEGARAVELVKNRGGKVFLDLKLHDIPETVSRAVASAKRLDVDLLTVHTAGGYEMMQKAAAISGGRPSILGVTVLTSLNERDLHADGVTGSMRDAVLRRAIMSSRAGIQGIVCSPEEVADVRKSCPNLTLVVPGIRPSGAEMGDQKRVATPARAIQEGADYLVVGRPIRDAAKPLAAFTSLVAEVEAALKLP